MSTRAQRIAAYAEAPRDVVSRIEELLDGEAGDLVATYVLSYLCGSTIAQHDRRIAGVMAAALVDVEGFLGRLDADRRPIGQGDLGSGSRAGRPVSAVRTTVS